MDPNKTLTDIVKAAQDLVIRDGIANMPPFPIEVVELAENVLALHHWLAGQGFLPDLWKRGSVVSQVITEDGGDVLLFIDDHQVSNPDMSTMEVGKEIAEAIGARLESVEAPDISDVKPDYNWDDVREWFIEHRKGAAR